MRTKFLSLFLALAVLLAGCAQATGLPANTGQYDLQAGSVCADGDRYQFHWVDAKGELHQAKTKVQAVTRGDRNYVEIQGKDKAVLHLTEGEAVPACPSDRSRTGWFPIPLPIGGPVIVDRDRTTTGSGGAGTSSGDNKGSLGIPKSKDAPFSVGGQSGGTGGGSAASGKSVSPFSGQSGGSGSGSAATGKSTSPSLPKITVPKIGGGRSFGGKR